VTRPTPEHRERLATILKALEDMAAGKLDRRAPISPDHDEIDAIAYTVNVLVAELHFTVDRLARAEREAQEANQQKSLFLRNVSHELRTPLAAMLSYTNLLSRSQLDGDQMKAVERIRANGDALHHLIEDLLDVVRIEAGKLQLVLEPVSPADVATDVVQSLLLQAKSKGLRLTLSIAPDLPCSIVTDSRRLRQILMNLVGNALKFTDRGEVAVSLRMDDRLNKLIIDVTDTGIGLREADKEQLFFAFVQSDTGRGGVGLGLVLARQLSRALSGDLDLVSSEPGQGSRFRVQLDIAGSSYSRPATSTPSISKPDVDLRGLSVLLAEDNADLLSACAALLELFGCSVEKVRNGAQAIDCVSSRHFDVVLMDMQMPILDGLEATRRLREVGFKGAIFALSAHAMADDRKRFIAAGCNDHIAKPIDIERLVMRLADFRPKK
jgi:signal transduction histidine kinase